MQAPITEPSLDALGTVVFVDHLRLDKREGLGEDADPVLIANNTIVSVGVFDGLGGAGAEVYQTNQGPRTGAAIGATVAAHATYGLLKDAQQPVTTNSLKDGIATELRTCLQQFSLGQPNLKGRLIRKLPTTVALGQVAARSLPNGTIHRFCVLHWAGDSRIYVLDYCGLRQLTRDHLVVQNDAMQNLLQDSELSNCASADGDFNIESSTIDIGVTPFILIAASDGVFGYLRTPMHFESLLLGAIARSHSFAEWKVDLVRQIASYTQDDASMAFASVGWPDFAAMKADLTERMRQVDEIVTRIDCAATEMEAARQAAANALEAYESECKSSWDSYRGGYEFLMPSGSHR